MNKTKNTPAKKPSKEIEEPGRTQGSAEGERDDVSKRPGEEAGRTPGSAEGK